MNLNSPFYYPVVMHDSVSIASVLAPVVENLPVQPEVSVIILMENRGAREQGLYLYLGRCWSLLLPMHSLSQSIIRGDILTVYANLVAPVQVPEGSFAWANGILYPEAEMVPGRLTYLVQTPPASSGSSYVLPTASATVLGGVKVGAGLSISAGTLSVTSAASSVTLNGDVTGNGTGLIETTLSNTGVTPGLYDKVTVDAKGRVTSGGSMSDADVLTALGFTPYDAANPAGYITQNLAITVSGDATGTGTSEIVLTLAASGAAAGTYRSVTIDAKGRVTSGTNPTTLLGYGITDALGSSGGSLTGTLTLSAAGKITGVPTPQVNGDAANKAYVDNSVAAALTVGTWKTAAQAASTENLVALSGLLVIDTHQTVEGDRVLVKDQSDATQNGVYLATAGAWTRAADIDTGSEIFGMAILVLMGSANKFGQWVNSNTTVPTVGTDAITFAQLANSSQTYTNGAGLSLIGNQFSITETGAIAGTYGKVTVNALGQVTVGAQLALADITTALGYTPYDSTNPDGYLTANAPTTLTGDVTGSGTGSFATALSTTGVSAGTFTKVTVDVKGRVTAGANLTGSDIATLLGYTPANRAGDTLTGALNWATTVSIAASGTTNIGTGVLSNAVIISGNTAITSLGPNTAGMQRQVVFSETPVLTHNAVSLQLPGAADINVAAGDAGLFVGLGGNNWKCVSYQRGDGTALVGGTGSDPTKLPLAGGTMSGAINEAPAVTITSSSVTNIAAAATNRITVTGANTITTFGTVAAGAVRRLSFSSAATLTHNATSLILPTAANITTAAGDVAQFTSLGSGNWKCDFYQRATGAPLIGGTDPSALPLAGGTMSGPINEAPAVTMTSSSVMNIGTANANRIAVTGTNTITSLGTIASGVVRRLSFSSAATLTHNATSLILPGGANITTAAGDVAQFTSLGSGNWKCDFYTRADGQAVVSSAGSASPFSTTQVFNGSATQIALKMKNGAELTNIVASAPTAVNASDGGTTYFTANTSAAWVANLRFNAANTLNSVMAVGDMMTVAMIVTQGATAFLPSAYQIDGVAVTPKWQGSAAPTVGTVDGLDVFTFTVLKTGSAAFQLLASFVPFK